MSAADPLNPFSTEEPEPQVTAQVIPPEERSLALLCHLLGIVLGFIGPLIIWLIKKDESPAINDQGKEALNFQLTVLLASLVCIPLLCIFIGFVLLPVIAIGSIVLAVIAAVKANGGEYYRYPVCWRMIK